MRETVVASLFALGLLVAMLLFLEGGRLLGARRLAKHPDGAPAGFGALEGAIFGLGFVRLDAIDHVLVELRERMK